MILNDEEFRLQKIYTEYSTNTKYLKKWDKNNPGNLEINKERINEIQIILKQFNYYPLSDKKILDIGCGVGEILNWFIGLGAIPENLYGVDLHPILINQAKEKFNNINFLCMNGEDLDFPDSTFDIVLLFTVFSSIMEEKMTINIAKKISRLLKNGGCILFYDFFLNNPFNTNVRGISRKKISQYFPEMEIFSKKITLLPLLARRLGRHAPILYPLFNSISLLHTHNFALIKKN